MSIVCKCGSDTITIASKTGNNIIYKRRRCKRCGNYIFTEERISENQNATRYMLGQLEAKRKEVKTNE